MRIEEIRLRAAFRVLNRNMLVLWRLGLGWQMANPASGYIMVLATTGRRSGERRLVPLNFAEQGDHIYCLAGFGKGTHWLLNLQADPECEVWLPDGRRLNGRAKLVTSEPQRIELVRQVLKRSGFAAKLAEPGVDPSSAPDDVIAGLGPQPDSPYEIVEIKVGDAVFGPGGPGDLKWVWPTVGFGAAVGWLILRRRPGYPKN